MFLKKKSQIFFTSLFIYFIFLTSSRSASVQSPFFHSSQSILRAGSNIESKSLNNTYLNIVEILLLFFFQFKNIEFKNLVIMLTWENRSI